MAGPETGARTPETSGFSTLDYIKKVNDVDSDVGAGKITFDQAIADLKKLRDVYEDNYDAIEANPKHLERINQKLKDLLEKIKHLKSATPAPAVTPTTTGATTPPPAAGPTPTAHGPVGAATPGAGAAHAATGPTGAATGPGGAPATPHTPGSVDFDKEMTKTRGLLGEASSVVARKDEVRAQQILDELKEISKAITKLRAEDRDAEADKLNAILTGVKHDYGDDLQNLIKEKEAAGLLATGLSEVTRLRGLAPGVISSADEVQAQVILDKIKELSKSVKRLEVAGRSADADNLDTELGRLISSYADRLQDMITTKRYGVDAVYPEIPGNEKREKDRGALKLANTPESEKTKLFFSEVKSAQERIASMTPDALSSYDEQEKQRKVIEMAKRRIDALFRYVGKERGASGMSLPQLLDEMEARNVNPDAHGAYEGVNVDPRRQELYFEFNKRKNGSANETAKEHLDRLEGIIGWKLTRAEDMNHNEGQKPSCTRSDLFPEMGNRDMERDDLLLYSTYHPEYGAQIRTVLRHLVWIITTRKHPVLNYESLMAHGRDNMRDYVNKLFLPQLKGEGYPTGITRMPDDKNSLMLRTEGIDDIYKVDPIYASLPPTERAKKAQEVADLTLRLFYFFDLLTVSLGELQKQTKTRAHDLVKKGAEIKDKDRILLSRPDVALVHRIQRYDAKSEWSSWWLPLMSEVPEEYGALEYDPDGTVKGATPADEAEQIKTFKRNHHNLVEMQHDLLAVFDASFDVDGFSGRNGIPPSDIWHPLFPDMLSYLTLQPGEQLVLGKQGAPDYKVIYRDKNGKMGEAASGEAILMDPSIPTDRRTNKVAGGEDIKSNVYSRDNYIAAEQGWEKMLELTFGSLPAEIKKDAILEHAGSMNTGLVDEIINQAAGKAKLVKGDHIKKAMTPLITLYLCRIFSRYEKNGAERVATFEAVVNKLSKSSESGVSAMQVEIQQVIKNISDGTGHKLGRMLALNRMNRQEKRAKLIDIVYREERKKIPDIANSVVINIRDALTGLVGNPIESAEAKEYVKMRDGDLNLPSIGVTRKGDLIRKKDD